MKKFTIIWKYFFGSKTKNTFDRYYRSSVNGIYIEKHASNSGTKYSIGNIDKAKIIYNSEEELLTALFNYNL